jgi:predicted Zn-ribbon and HTH transcriptional regulator
MSRSDRGTKERSNPMTLLDARCTSCGATLKVDGSLRADICPQCKEPYAVEKALQYYYNRNITELIRQRSKDG